jgi:hypothetical protein
MFAAIAIFPLFCSTNWAAEYYKNTIANFKNQINTSFYKYKGPKIRQQIFLILWITNLFQIAHSYGVTFLRYFLSILTTIREIWLIGKKSIKAQKIIDLSWRRFGSFIYPSSGRNLTNHKNRFIFSKLQFNDNLNPPIFQTSSNKIQNKSIKKINRFRSKRISLLFAFLDIINSSFSLF